MSYESYSANPSSVTIQYATPASTYSNSTAAWVKPGSQYTMKSLQLAFTTANTGYYVYVTHQVNGDTVGVGTYTSGAAAGNKLITLPTSAWSGSGGETLTLRFRRPETNAQTYSNIRLIVNYEIIASASTAAAVDAIAGDAQTVNITNTDSTVTHAVTWQYGSLSGSTFTSLVTSGAQTYGAATRSPGWAVPAASLATLYAANGSRTTIPGRITVQTYLEGNSLGSTTVEALLTIPNDNTTRPTLTVATDADQDSVATASGEDWLQNHTTLEITPTAAAQAGAALAAITITTPDGAETGTSGTETDILIRTAGSYPVTVTATDSRGYSSTWTQTLTVTACGAPAITAITAERCDQDGTPNDEGTYASIQASAIVTAIADVDSWTYTLRRAGSSAVIESGTLTDGAGIIGGSLSPEASYTVTVTVEDTLGQTASATAEIGSAIYTIHRMAGGKGVAFGKVSEKYGVELNPNWPLFAHGQEILELMVDIAHPVGSVVQTADEDWNPNEQWPWTTWVQLTDVFLKASGTDAALDTGGSDSAAIPTQTVSTPAQNVTLTPANMPIYTVYARLSNGSSANYEGYSSDPVTTMGYRAHSPGSNSPTASDWRYLISRQAAQAFSIPSASMSIPGQTISTLPPYLAVATWMRVPRGV